MKRLFTLLMIIISLSTEVSYGSPRIMAKIARERADNLNYMLSENVFPEHYTLKITPQFNNRTFIGYAKVLIHVKIPTDNITLHQMNLNITKENIYLTTIDNVVINIKDANKSGTKDQEFYTITFANLLMENIYYLHFSEFHGILNTENIGFYYAEYKEKNGQLRSFAMTKFESTTARYAFPCFDEPSFRAKFKIYIVRPSNYHSGSNTKLIKSIKLNDNLYEDEFAETLSMSTYLVEYIVSEMKITAYQETDFHKILARPEAIQKNYEKYSLNASVKILKTLETYLNVNYSMDKMVQAAIPDTFHPSGAAEHWGLVTYKERNLLLTPKTSTAGQMNIDRIIAHEFTHQWFGNLVSIKWWRYLWLKEGFANFLQSKIIDKIKPEWRMMERFIVKIKHEVLRKDGSKFTREMNQDAGTPKEIRQLYDSIAYDKSACVIQMLETILTPKVFERGLTNFLQDRAFQSCIPIDLYRNLQKSLDNSAVKLPRNLSIEKIMTTWASQKGYPLVYVERNYDKSPKVVKLNQSRYIFNPVGKSKQETWHIPINYASKSNPNFKDTRFSNWLLAAKENIIIRNLKRDDWLIVNKQEAYYYRVNYDAKNWKLIAKALKENYKNIHTLNRAQLIDDSFIFADMNLLDYSIPLEISSYLEQEDNYITDYAFIKSLDYIAKILRGSDVEPNFRDYVIRSFKSTYNRLGNNPRANDTHIDKLHRVLVVRWMCKYNYSQCRANTWKTFRQWKTINRALAVDLQEVILCNGIRYGNQNDWDYLWREIEAADDVNFEMHAFDALGCTENVTMLQRFMDMPLILSSYHYLHKVVALISEKGSVGSEVAMLYVAKHFNFLYSKYSESLVLKILGTITSYFTFEAQLENFTKLLIENRTVDPIVLTFLEKTRPVISRKQRRVQQIAKFYYDYRHNIINQTRFSGSSCRTFPNIFACIVYTLILVVIIFYK